jgi:hypothetical protein
MALNIQRECLFREKFAIWKSSMDKAGKILHVHICVHNFLHLFKASASEVNYIGVKMQ